MSFTRQCSPLTVVSNPDCKLQVFRSRRTTQVEYSHMPSGGATTQGQAPRLPTRCAVGSAGAAPTVCYRPTKAPPKVRPELVGFLQVIEMTPYCSRNSSSNRHAIARDRTISEESLQSQGLRPPLSIVYQAQFHCEKSLAINIHVQSSNIVRPAPSASIPTKHSHSQPIQSISENQPYNLSPHNGSSRYHPTPKHAIESLPSPAATPLAAREC